MQKRQGIKKQLSGNEALVITLESSVLHQSVLTIRLNETPADERSKKEFMLRCKNLGLTKRNAETLCLKSLGLCYKDIAELFSINYSSVGNKLNRIYAQLEVVNIAAAINKVWGM